MKSFNKAIQTILGAFKYFITASLTIISIFFAHSCEHLDVKRVDTVSGVDDQYGFVLEVVDENHGVSIEKDEELDSHYIRTTYAPNKQIRLRFVASDRGPETKRLRLPEWEENLSNGEEAVIALQSELLPENKEVVFSEEGEKELVFEVKGPGEMTVLFSRVGSIYYDYFDAEYTFIVEKRPQRIGAIEAQTITYGSAAKKLDLSFLEIIHAGIGALSAESDNTAVLTASLNGSNLTFTPQSAGKATVVLRKAETKYFALEEQSFVVTVAKDEQSIAVIEEQSFTYNDTAKALTVASTGDGALAASSDNTNIATVTMAGSTLTLKPVNSGTATITLSKATTMNYIVAPDVTFNVTVKKATQTIVAPSTQTFTFSDSPRTLTVVSIGDGALSASSDDTNTATVTMTGSTLTLTPVNVGTVTITLSKALTANYVATPAVTFNVVVNKGTQTITAPSAQDLTFGSSAIGLAITNTGDGILSARSDDTNIATASIVDSTLTLTPVNVGTATITLNKTATANYNAAVDVTFEVNVKTAQTITAPVNQTFAYNDTARALVVSSTGTGALSAESSDTNMATVTVTVDSTLTLTPVNAGTATITLRKAATPDYNAAPAVTFVVTVNKAAQTITALGDETFAYNDTVRALTVASIGAGALTVTSSDTNIATVSVTASTLSLTPVNAGTATITLGKAATTNYATAPNLSFTVTVAKVAQMITTPSSKTYTYGDSATTLEIVSTGAGALSAESSDTNMATVTMTGSTLTLTPVNVGTATITLSKAVAANYTAAPDVSFTVTVNKAAQTIIVPSVQPFALDDSTTDLTITNTGDGILSAMSDDTNTATVTMVGSTLILTPVGVGTATITLSKAATANYIVAPDVSFAVTVNKAAQTITVPSVQPFTLGDSAIDLTITNTGDGILSAMSDDTNTATVSVTDSTLTLTPVNAGTATITLSKAATANYSAAPDVTFTVTVSLAAQTITAPAEQVFTFGDSATTLEIVSIGDGALSAVSDDINTATVSIVGSILTLTPVNAGTATIILSKAKTANYSASPDVTFVVTVAKAAQTIAAITAPALIYNGGSQSVDLSGAGDGDFGVTIAATDQAFVTGTVDNTVIPPTLTLAPIAATTIAKTITVSRGETANYVATDATFTVTVAKAAQAITAPSNQIFTYGDADAILPIASTGETIVFTALSDDETIVLASVSGNDVILSIEGAGSVMVTLSKAATANYNAAPNVTFTVTVNKATQTITAPGDWNFTFGNSAITLEIASTGDGALSAGSDETNTATVTMTGSTLTLTPVNAGTATITLSKVATANYSVALDVTFTVTVNQANQAALVLPSSYNIGGSYKVSLSALKSPADSATIAVTGGSNSGVLSISTAPDSTKATASLTGAQLTITAKASGATTLGLTKAGDVNYNSVSLSVAIDINVDNDGDDLIDIWTLDQLNNIRYNLDGSGYKVSAQIQVRTQVALMQVVMATNSCET